MRVRATRRLSSRSDTRDRRWEAVARESANVVSRATVLAVLEITVRGELGCGDGVVLSLILDILRVIKSSGGFCRSAYIDWLTKGDVVNTAIAVTSSIDITALVFTVDDDSYIR